MEEGIKILELAQRLVPLYVAGLPDEKQEILKFLLWNCTLKDVTPTPVYRKPFNWLVELSQLKEWRGRRDDFGTTPPEPVASFVTQFRDWCFSGELAQLAYQIPILLLAT